MTILHHVAVPGQIRTDDANMESYFYQHFGPMPFGSSQDGASLNDIHIAARLCSLEAGGYAERRVAAHRQSWPLSRAIGSGIRRLWEHWFENKSN